MNASQVLREIDKEFIRLDENDIRKSNLVMDYIRNNVIPEMKKRDELFNILYQDIYYGGSFYKGLKIGTPDEFDLNIELNSDLIASITQFVQGDDPGYVKMEVIRPKRSLPSNSPLKPFLKEFMCFFEPTGNQKRYKYILVPARVREWLWKVFKRADPYLPNHVGTRSIISRHKQKNGPALTLKMVIEKDIHVDVDLVAVWPFYSNEWLKHFGVWNQISANQNRLLHGRSHGYEENIQKGLKEKFFLVPISKSKFGPDWAIDFPKFEKSIIHDLGCVKPVIRYLKVNNDFFFSRVQSNYITSTTLDPKFLKIKF